MRTRSSLRHEIGQLRIELMDTQEELFKTRIELAVAQGIDRRTAAAVEWVRVARAQTSARENT